MPPAGQYEGEEEVYYAEVQTGKGEYVGCATGAVSLLEPWADALPLAQCHGGNNAIGIVPQSLAAIYAAQLAARLAHVTVQPLPHHSVFVPPY